MSYTYRTYSLIIPGSLFVSPSYLSLLLPILTRKGSLAYLVLVAPFSVVRFLEFSHINIESGGVLAVASLFALTGVVDVVLFIGAGPAFGMNFSG
jgi:hypothetical protein